jgi:hypothetical protein
MAWLKMRSGKPPIKYTKYTFVSKSTGPGDASIYVKRYRVVGNTETLTYDGVALFTSSGSWINDSNVGISYTTDGYQWILQIKKNFHWNNITNPEQSARNLYWGYGTAVNYTIIVED